MFRTVMEWGPVASSLIVLVHLALSWRQLPARLVARVDLAGVPAAWMDRRTFAVVVLGVMAGVFGVAPFVARRLAGPVRQCYLGLTWGSAAGLVIMLWQLIDLSRVGTPLRLGWAAVAGLAAAFLAAAAERIAQDSTRPLATGTEGDHVGSVVSRSRRSALVGFAFCLVPIVVFFVTPSTGLRLFLVGGLAVGLWGSFGPWLGFRYDFTFRGVQITGVWPLRYFVPREEILGWETAGRPPGVYGGGLRTVSGGRAYVWGSGEGLLIKTRSGFVFLGGDAARMAAHLEAAMGDGARS